MLKNLRKNKKGFTLIEIIVVVVILAVLMAVAVPSVLKYIDEADNAKYMAQARAIMTSAQAEIIKDYAPDKKMDKSADYVQNVNIAVADDGMNVTTLELCSDKTGETPITVSIVEGSETTPQDVVSYKATWTYDGQTVTAVIVPNGSIEIQ